MSYTYNKDFRFNPLAYENELRATMTRPGDGMVIDTKELQVRFQEQNEWYRLHGGTQLCDCSNCINARELKASPEPEISQPDSQPDISQQKIQGFSLYSDLSFHPNRT
jgi:hypothetical protein